MPREVSPRSRRRIPITAELLSAYLDNQVTPEERAAVEQAIAEDPAIAEQARALSQTVVLLRALPRAPVPRAFTLSEADVAAAHTPWWERNWRRLAFALYLRGAALVAAALFVAVVVADLRQGQLSPTTIGAERGLTTAVARGDVPAAAAPVGVESVQPTPFELPVPGEANLAAASPTVEAIIPEAGPAEEAPTEEARLLALPAESSPTMEAEPPALAAELPTEGAESPTLAAEPSPTALPAPTQAPLPAEEPLEEAPLAAAPAMGGGLLEPLDQEGAGVVARGGGVPSAPGLGGAGGMGGGAEGPFARRPPAFGFAPPPVGGEQPTAAAPEDAEAPMEPVVEALATPTAAVAMEAPASESPTVEPPAEGVEILAGPAIEAPATESLTAESPTEAAAPEAAAAALPAETPTVEPLAMKASAAEPAAESAMEAAPTATLMLSPTPTMPPSPTEAPTAEPPAEKSLAGEAPTATLMLSPTPTMPPSPTAPSELPTARSESPTPLASPSPAPSLAPMAQEEAAAQQAGQAEVGLRFGPWTLTPGQARALEVALGTSVVILLAASWLVRRR